MLFYNQYSSNNTNNVGKNSNFSERQKYLKDKKYFPLFPHVTRVFCYSMFSKLWRVTRRHKTAWQWPGCDHDPLATKSRVTRPRHICTGHHRLWRAETWPLTGVPTRASNQGSWGYHNHREGPFSWWKCILMLAHLKHGGINYDWYPKFMTTYCYVHI